MKKWQCVLCGFIYDEAAGLPEEGIAPGTPWEAVPEDWTCPHCSATKVDFDMVAIG
jgi:rubredoxin